MTLLGVGVLLWLVLEGNNLLFLALLINSTFNSSTVNKWRADLNVVAAYKDNLVKSYLFAFFCVQLFNVDSFDLLLPCIACRQ